MQLAPGPDDGIDPRPYRRAVLGAAVATLVLKLWMAATTYGTNDITHWLDYMRAVRRAGPVGVYGISMPITWGNKVIQLYNHPPLIGYFLQLVGFGDQHGVTAQFTIRATSSLADVATAVLVFELLRRRVPLRRAAASGVLVASSPVLFVISGYHGNTDPDFVLFALLSVYLLVDRRAPAWAGIAIGIAISIKIVPILLVPTLAVYAARQGRGMLLRLTLGCGGTMALIWSPALLAHADAVRHNVLGYAGLSSPEWGLDLLVNRTRNSNLIGFVEGPGRGLIVAACAVVPAIAVWRRPTLAVSAAALSLCAFLAFTPAFGTQYLAWAAAPVLLLTFWGGVAFNIAGGVLLFAVYTTWNHGLPWDHAHAGPFTVAESELGLFAWTILCLCVYLAARAMAQAVVGKPFALPTGPAEAVLPQYNGRDVVDSPDTAANSLTDGLRTAEKRTIG